MTNVTGYLYSDWTLDKECSDALDFLESKIAEDSPLVKDIGNITCFLIRSCYNGVNRIDPTLDSKGVFDFVKPILRMLFIYYCTPFGNLNFRHNHKLCEHNMEEANYRTTELPSYYDKYYRIITDKNITTYIETWYKTFETFVNSLMSEEHYNSIQTVNVTVTVAFLRARD